MSFFKENKTRIFSVIALTAILCLMASMIQSPGVITTKVYAETVDYYELRVGGEKVALFETEADAKDIIKQVRETYVGEDSEATDVKISPAMTVEKITVLKNAEQPEVNEGSAVLEELLVTETTQETYTVQEGDTLWDISESVGASVEEIADSNPDVDIENIIAGDEILVNNGTRGLVNVTAVYEEVSEEVVYFDTIYVEDPWKYSDEEDIVETEGVDGLSRVTVRITQVNGNTEKVEEVEREVIQEPVDQVIIYGTLERPVEETEEIASEEEVIEEVVEEEEAFDGVAEEEAVEEVVEEETEEVAEEEPAEEAEEESEEEAVAEEPEEEAEEEPAEEESEEEAPAEEPEEVAEEEAEEETAAPTSASDNQQESFGEVEETEVTPVAESTSASREQIVNYAQQFIGNPYVWGGTDPRNGADCSGFVWAVFNECGYNINRFPDDDFPHVSASELKPGDICRYEWHSAIYIGNGMEISAVNEEQGIKIHPMYYSRSPFWYGIRVIND